MLTCPECKEALARTRDAGDPQWSCSTCRSRVLTLAGIARVTAPEFGRALRQEIDLGNARAGAPCPSCARAVRVLQVPVRAGICVLDLCTSCRLVRLRGEQHAKLPLKSRLGPDPTLDPAEAARQAVLAQIDHENQRGFGRGR